MKFTKSIRFRIIVACIVFALIVSSLFGLILALSIKINADEQFNWHMEKEMAYFLEEYKKNKKVEFNLSRGKIIIGKEKEAIKHLKNMIDSQSNTFSEQTLESIPLKRFHKVTEEGYTFYYYDSKVNVVYLLKAPLSSEDLNIYYFIDLTGFDRSDNMGANISLKFFFVMLISILLLAVFIGLYIAKKVLIPLTNLTSNVDKIDIGKYKSNVNDYYHDEIGFLAEKIDSFVKRTADFVQREKSFTRDASHELRTPIASSQAALDVAFALSEGQNPKMQKILNRIQRANKNMTHLIESFLILGRETQKNRDTLPFMPKELVNTSINKNSYLLNSKNITYKNQINKELIFNLHKEYLTIVIDNLIRNAFVHMQEGELIISAENDLIIIHDSGEWFGENKELGIGLNIVKRICKEEDWNLSISTEKGLGTKIEIKF